MSHVPIHSNYHAALNLPLGEPVALAVRAAELGSAFYLNGRPGYRARFFAQRNMQPLSTHPFTDDRLADMVVRGARHGGVLIARGAFLPESRRADGAIRDGDPINLRLDSLSVQVPRTALLGATEAEIAAADARIDACQGEGVLFCHLIDTLHRVLGVAHRSLSPRFLRAERLVLCQAASGGEDPSLLCNPRLSLYLVSAPGKGKKILGEMAQALAPASHLAQPAMLTPAGLGVHVEPTRGGWRSMPGALPLCDKGVLVIDDIHRLERSQRNQLEGVLMTATEDGFVTATKSHIGRFQAHCGVLLTGNPGSTLPGYNPQRRAARGKGPADERAAEIGRASCRERVSSPV